MATCVDVEWPDIHAYEATVLPLITELTARLQRGREPLTELFVERGNDASWRAQQVAEYRSWRMYLDALPSAAPAPFTQAHARMLRWAATVAAGGDALAAAVEAHDPGQLITASQQLLQHERLYEAMLIALDHAIATTHR